MRTLRVAYRNGRLAVKEVRTLTGGGRAISYWNLGKMSRSLAEATQPLGERLHHAGYGAGPEGRVAIYEATSGSRARILADEEPFYFRAEDADGAVVREHEGAA